jgi:hypothetical protein
MFISKSRLLYLEQTINHLENRLDSERDKRYSLENRLDSERDKRYRLEEQVSMLLDHLKLEIATYPAKMLIRDKHD